MNTVIGTLNRLGNVKKMSKIFNIFSSMVLLLWSMFLVSCKW